MTEVITQPVQSNVAPPPPPGFSWGSPEGVMLIVALLGAIAGLAEGFTNHKQIGRQSRQLAGMASQGLAVAEAFGAGGESVKDLRRILKAYSQSHPLVAQEQANLHVSSDDVADMLHFSSPEFVSELIDLPPAKAQEAILFATQEAARSIHGDPKTEAEELPDISPEMQASREALAQKLAELHPGRRKS